ncbi:MAG: relaxase domain-containing protein [Gammaproteobacteria bacterium]|nr:relaxase domain-containing protein [Gammaproteobacteria bacterium]
MLRVYSSKSAAQAKDYFSHELTVGDYYGEGQEIVGVWGGTAAEWLGLSGQVDQDAFNALVDNQYPETTPLAGEQLTPHNKANRRPGYDLTFNAPKALSLLYEYSQDERLLDAFRDAVHLTMDSIEEGMHTRVRKGGVNEERQTGNLAYAEFVHFTARPTENLPPDPHLHAHCFAMNLTYDAVEDQWKAGEFEHIKTDAPYYEALFHSHLTKTLSELGLNITRDGQFWTLEELDKETLKKFSHRTEEIEAMARELGLQSDKQKDNLGASTRGSKDKQYARESLRKTWWERLDDDERKLLDNLSKFEATEDTKPPTFTAEETVEFAIKHKLERQSVASVKRIKEAAMRQGFGDVAPEQVDTAFADNDDVIVVGDNATTKTILAQESQIIQFTREGYAQQDKLNADYSIGLVTDHSTGQQFELSEEQQNVVSTLLDSRHRIQAIQGKAGTGKTTTLATLIDGIEAGGGGAMVLAPTADAAYDTLQTDGEKYQCEAMQQAHTLARFFVDEKLWEQSRGHTLIVDEAGLMSVDDMHTLFALADQFDQRVILVGDTSQHNSVMRGDAYRILQEQAGLTPVSLEAIHRQQGEYRDAVKVVSEGKLVEGFNRLDGLGKVIELDDADERYSTLASRYAEVFDPKHKSTLAVAPTHTEGRRVTAAIRESLKERSLVSDEDHAVTRWKNLNLTEAERGDAFHYETGQKIRFQQNAKGDHGRIDRGSEFTVSRIDKQQVWMSDANGNEQPLNLSQAKKFNVYETEALNLAVGDHLRITEGHKSKEGRRLNNGAIYRIDSVKENGDLKLENGATVEASKGNFAHGYVTTSMASQGKSINHVFLAQGTDYGGATSAEQFYVSVSRGKKSVEIFTDDKDTLREQIQRSHQRLSATELVGKQNASNDDFNKSNLVASMEYYARQFMAHMRDTVDDFFAAFRRGDPQSESTKWRDYVRDREHSQSEPQQDREMGL